MAYPIVESAVDVAYWFFDKASDENKILDENKMQALLFWSLLTYAKAYNREMLFPALFVCDDEGFYEPNLKKILELGRPFLPRGKFTPKITDFLNEMWKKFASKSFAELQKIIRTSCVYKENAKNGAKVLVDFHSIVESLNKSSIIADDDGNRNKPKVLLSQHGPVIVSPWKPRKVSSHSKS